MGQKVRKMAARSLERVKQRICAQPLTKGDLVRAPDGKWEESLNPMGIKGRWAIYVGVKGRSAVVRPLGADGVPRAAVEVPRVEQAEEVLTQEARREYLQRRGLNGTAVPPAGEAKKPSGRKP